MIHSTQCYIKYINRAILANLQRRPLKLGRHIVLQKTKTTAIKKLFPRQLTLFQSIPTWFQYVSDFQLENIKEGHKLKLTYLCACWITCRRHHLQIWIGTPKVARNVFNIGEVWNLVCCMVTKLFSSKLWSTFSRILLQRIKPFCYKLAEIFFIIIFDENLVECMTSSPG